MSAEPGTLLRSIRERSVLEAEAMEAQADVLEAKAKMLRLDAFALRAAARAVLDEEPTMPVVSAQEEAYINGLRNDPRRSMRG